MLNYSNIKSCLGQNVFSQKCLDNFLVPSRNMNKDNWAITLLNKQAYLKCKILDFYFQLAQI